MTPLLEVRHLSAGYETPLLRDISFSAGAGEIIGILGRNGCGKTTLLRGLSGAARRFAGEILVDGQDCAHLDPKQQAAYLSVLPQQTQILEGISARQLIEMGRYPYDSFFAPVSQTRCILENARRLEIGQLLEQDCARLSQGQRQMVLLCRLLVQDTPVMLLDEPNAALDYDNTFSMFRILKETVQEKEKTALMVLHDPELALAHCHRLLILKDGRICRDISLDRTDEAGVQEALQQIYPHVNLRKDPFDGRFRCYHQ